MNKTVFIIRNQDELYLDTQDQWATPDSEQPPFHSPHKDVALNKLFEMTLADATLRGKVDSCPADAKGRPLLTEATEATEATDAPTNHGPTDDALAPSQTIENPVPEVASAEGHP